MLGLNNCTMKNNYALKDCPFCGARPDISYKALSGVFWSGDVKCRKCGLKMHFWGFTPSEMNKNMIDKWNKRV